MDSTNEGWAIHCPAVDRASATIIAMNSNPSSPRRIAVIGGGIAGLAAAHRLVELDPQLRADTARGRSATRRRALDRPRRRFPGRAERRQLHHHRSLGRESLQAAGPGRPTRPDQSGLPADVCRAAGTLAPPAGRLSDDGPHAALAAGGHSDPQPAGQAPRGVGIFHSAARRPERREHGRRSFAAGWDAKRSTGWSSRWSARSTRPTWRSSACWPRCRVSGKWSATTAA